LVTAEAAPELLLLPGLLWLFTVERRIKVALDPNSR
jgi:hypothetical protein